MSDNFYPHKTINGKKDKIHRHIMAEHLGRELDKDEHVYHINGISTDNTLENLVYEDFSSNVLVIRHNSCISIRLEKTIVQKE